MAASSTKAGMSQVIRNQPITGSTGIHARAERQMRRLASAVARIRAGPPTRTQSFTIGLPRETPTSSAVMATAPAISPMTDRLM